MKKGNVRGMNMKQSREPKRVQRGAPSAIAAVMWRSAPRLWQVRRPGDACAGGDAWRKPGAAASTGKSESGLRRRGSSASRRIA